MRGDFYTRGPRPALMWIGVAGVAVQVLLFPLATFAYTTISGHPLPVKPPEMDPSLLTMLGSLMGVQIVARSWEKAKGVTP